MNQISFHSSLNAIKQDKSIIKKIIIGCLFMIIMTLLNYYKNKSPIYSNLISCLIQILLMGYFAKVVNEKFINPHNDFFNWQKFSELFYLGLQQTAATIIIIITPIILLFVSIAFLSQNFAFIGLLIFGIAIIFTLVAITYFIVAHLSYLSDLKFKSFFDMKKNGDIIIKNPKLFGQYIGYLTIYTLAFIFGTLTLAITIIGIILIPALSMLFIYLIADLDAQFLRGIFHTEQY